MAMDDLEIINGRIRHLNQIEKKERKKRIRLPNVGTVRCTLQHIFGLSYVVTSLQYGSLSFAFCLIAR